MRNIQIKNEIDRIKKWENKVKRKDLIYKVNKFKYDFQQYEIMRYFDERIYTGKINIAETEMNQSSILENMVEFNDKFRPSTKGDKEVK